MIGPRTDHLSYYINDSQDHDRELEVVMMDLENQGKKEKRKTETENPNNQFSSQQLNSMQKRIYIRNHKRKIDGVVV
jgi:hypothetical protein